MAPSPLSPHLNLGRTPRDTQNTQHFPEYKNKANGNPKRSPWKVTYWPAVCLFPHRHTLGIHKGVATHHICDHKKMRRTWPGNFLAVPRLEFRTSTAAGTGAIPGRGTKILHGAQSGQKRSRERGQWPASSVIKKILIKTQQGIICHISDCKKSKVSLQLISNSSEKRIKIIIYIEKNKAN